MASLVFSYAHADEGLRNELEKHLSPLKRMGRIATWHDRRIVPGEEFTGQIDQHFAEADILLLLISSDFIASDYCYQIEMTNALQRHQRGAAIVIPVILRPCSWQQLPFGKLLAATVDGKSITQFASYDEGFVQVVDAVSRALDKLEATAPQPTTASPSGIVIPTDAHVSTGSSREPRSSNLAIPRNFTDLDRDRALREGFDYLARFFENSLEELKQRNPGLETNFHRRDADAFESTAYLDGLQASHCGIWRGKRGDMLGDICFSASGISEKSCNASVSITNNGQLIGFRPLIGGGGPEDQLLTNEGMAEHLWDLFITHLRQRR